MTLAAIPTQYNARQSDAHNLIHAVCHIVGASPILFWSADRHAPLPLARQLAAWLLHQQGWTIRQLAELLDRSTGTVTYSLHNLERRRRHEWEIADLIRKIRIEQKGNKPWDSHP